MKFRPRQTIRCARHPLRSRARRPRKAVPCRRDPERRARDVELQRVARGAVRFDGRSHVRCEGRHRLHDESAHLLRVAASERLLAARADVWISRAGVPPRPLERVCRRAVGISDAAIAAPPRGTRFNYLATGSGGVLVRVRPRVHALAALQWIHVSNNSLKGPGRNPDIEAVGPRIGVVVGF